jgi:hypothetical protein
MVVTNRCWLHRQGSMQMHLSPRTPTKLKQACLATLSPNFHCTKPKTAKFTLNAFVAGWSGSINMLELAMLSRAWCLSAVGFNDANAARAATTLSVRGTVGMAPSARRAANASAFVM